MKKLIAVLFLLSMAAYGQVTNPGWVVSVPFCDADPPVDACGSTSSHGNLCVDDTSDVIYICQAGSWVAVADGGDADTLDGLDSLAFLKADGSVTGTGTQIFNSALPLDLTDDDPVIWWGVTQAQQDALTFRARATGFGGGTAVDYVWENEAGAGSMTLSVSDGVQNWTGSGSTQFAGGAQVFDSTTTIQFEAVGQREVSGPAFDFNTDAADSDFRIATSASANFFFLDSSTEELSIDAGVSPATTLDVGGTGITTTGLACTDCVALTTETSGNYVASATASQGLTLTGTEAGSLGLQDCAAYEVLERNSGDTAWACVPRNRGIAVLVDGEVTISTTAAHTGQQVLIQHLGSSMVNAGHLYQSNIAPGVSFDIVSSNSSDTDSVFWFMVD